MTTSPPRLRGDVPIFFGPIGEVRVLGQGLRWQFRAIQSAALLAFSYPDRDAALAARAALLKAGNAHPITRAATFDALVSILVPPPPPNGTSE